MNEEQAQMKNVLFWTRFWDKSCTLIPFRGHSQMMFKEWGFRPEKLDIIYERSLI